MSEAAAQSDQTEANSQPKGEEKAQAQAQEVQTSREMHTSSGSRFDMSNDSAFIPLAFSMIIIFAVISMAFHLEGDRKLNELNSFDNVLNLSDDGLPEKIKPLLLQIQKTYKDHYIFDCSRNLVPRIKQLYQDRSLLQRYPDRYPQMKNQCRYVDLARYTDGSVEEFTMLYGQRKDTPFDDLFKQFGVEESTDTFVVEESHRFKSSFHYGVWNFYNLPVVPNLDCAGHTVIPFCIPRYYYQHDKSFIFNVFLYPLWNILALTWNMTLFLFTLFARLFFMVVASAAFLVIYPIQIIVYLLFD